MLVEVREVETRLDDAVLQDGAQELTIDQQRERLLDQVKEDNKNVAYTTRKIKELQERLQASNSSVTEAVKDLKLDGNKNSSIGLYTMIIGYIVFSYVFK